MIMAKMFDVKIIPHRNYLMANTPDQKLFIELKLNCDKKAVLKSSLAAAFVVDTSGSMREVTGGNSKISILIDGLKKIINSSKLKNTDRISIIKFDDTAKVLLPFANIEEKNKATINAAIEDLTNYSGGTSMGAGLKEAFNLISKEKGNRRIIVLTDGQTSDEDLAKEISAELAKENIPVTAIGIGDEWNENLITYITDQTQGKPFYAVTDGSGGGISLNIAINSTEIPEVMINELESAVNEIITGLSLSINTAKDVQVDKITRVYPEVSEVDLAVKPHSLGNINAEGEMAFIIEATIPERKPLKSRLMQLSLTYDVPNADYRGENPPEDIIVEFTTDESKASFINQEVMQWVQQRNVGVLLERAITESVQNPENASKTLDMARRMTLKIGNGVMSKLIEQAQNEIKDNKTISLGMSKTLKIGAKTKTVKIDGREGLSDEQIRKMTGV
jgi:Ca-activated chloride channel family protein